MTPDTVVIITAYNRPRLVRDAICSVLGQDCDRWRLIIMDDGSNEETRAAVQQACGNPIWITESTVEHGRTLGVPRIDEHIGKSITWWQGPDRPMTERKANISYSVNINTCLNHLLRPTDKYISYLCDDDQYYPESVRVRAEFLDTHPDVHVVYGRSRSVQYSRTGFNTWDSAAPPKAGRFYPRPTGERILMPNGLSARHYFRDGEVDPETGLDYVEEAFFREGLSQYGQPGMIDHNSFMHRRECLTTCRQWPTKGNGSIEYWGEALSYGVGDAAFLTLLGEAHTFYGIPEWVVTKKYHGFSDGAVATEARE